jgi:hypothetical protein
MADVKPENNLLNNSYFHKVNAKHECYYNESH